MDFKGSILTDPWRQDMAEMVRSPKGLVMGFILTKVKLDDGPGPDQEGIVIQGGPMVL